MVAVDHKVVYIRVTLQWGLLFPLPIRSPCCGFCAVWWQLGCILFMITPAPACVQEIVRLPYHKTGACGSLRFWSDLQSLTDSPALLFSWVDQLSCCRVIYNHGRALQSGPDGYSHISSPKSVPLTYLPYTNTCLHWHLWLQNWRAARPLNLFWDDEHMAPKLHFCNSGSKSNIVLLFSLFFWTVPGSVKAISLTVADLNWEMPSLLLPSSIFYCYSSIFRAFPRCLLSLLSF